jgi:hypothetical protein
MFRWFVVTACVLLAVRIGWAQNSRGHLDAMIATHAASNGVPPSLVRRVVMRESRYNPRAVSRGNYGLMQIRLGTARAMGYRGSAQGLLDPNTNMTYAVRYLAGAYRAAGGNEARAISYYQRGYHHAAKRRGVQTASWRWRDDAQSRPAFGNWPMASPSPSPRRQRATRYAAQPVFSPFEMQIAQAAPVARHRNVRHRAPANASAFAWQRTQWSSRPGKRNLRYATRRTPSLFDWRVASANSAKAGRHTHRSARQPDLIQSLQRWFTQQRVRMARLQRTSYR